MLSGDEGDGSKANGGGGGGGGIAAVIMVLLTLGVASFVWYRKRSNRGGRKGRSTLYQNLQFDDSSYMQGMDDDDDDEDVFVASSRA